MDVPIFPTRSWILTVDRCGQAASVSPYFGMITFFTDPFPALLSAVPQAQCWVADKGVSLQHRIVLRPRQCDSPEPLDRRHFRIVRPNPRKRWPTTLDLSRKLRYRNDLRYKLMESFDFFCVAASGAIFRDTPLWLIHLKLRKLVNDDITLRLG